MADDNQQSCEEPRGQQQHGGLFAPVIVALTVINRAIAAFFHGAVRDDALVSAFHMGRDELGQALQALPDSVHGAGGTVHGSEQDHSPAPLSPSDIARGPTQTGHGQQQQGNVHQAPLSPSDIARGTDNGHVLTQERPENYWTDKIDKERKGNQGGNADNDQNEQGKGRSLPEEQKEKENDQDRSRGR